jgi:hypothetical protein
MEMNVEKPEIMRILKQSTPTHVVGFLLGNSPASEFYTEIKKTPTHIMVDQKQPENVEYFK